MTNTQVSMDNRHGDNGLIESSQVNGWGIDSDPENDPTYPMKRRNNAEHAGYTWERPPQQTIDIEILHSNERPNVSATFGTATPPAGVSGMLRRIAFAYSENAYAHWLPLMLADRIGVLEGIVDDVAHGHLPNIFGEMGMKAEWKHNKRRLVTRVALGTLLAATAIAVFRRNRNAKSENAANLRSS